MTAESFLVVDFAFIADPKLRRLIQQFHSEACQAYSHGLYVSVVVLAGGILEGLLTFALQRHQAEARERYQQLARTKGRRATRVPRIRDWHLQELIEVGSTVPVIGMTSSDVAPAVRDFRNFIHPYQLLRMSAQRWDALATMSLAAVAQISHSIEGRMKT